MVSHFGSSLLLGIYQNRHKYRQVFGVFIYRFFSSKRDIIFSIEKEMNYSLTFEEEDNRM